MQYINPTFLWTEKYLNPKKEEKKSYKDDLSVKRKEESMQYSPVYM